MTTPEVAARLVELCRQSDYHTAHAELYADDAKSVEPDFAPKPVSQGREALKAKGEFWESSFDEHGSKISDPVIAGDFFSISVEVDVTDKKSGARFTMQEIAVYQVKDGKIVLEQFFYPPMGG
jgi:hypothetical protein